jgi:hypothetical protein
MLLLAAMRGLISQVSLAKGEVHWLTSRTAHADKESGGIGIR